MRPELLAPAGDFERLRSAVLYGADAVYLGGRTFGMRAAQRNFGEEELPRAAEYCHSRGVKLYLTCNTLPTNEEAAELPGFIRRAAEAGADALIVADIGALMLSKRLVPDLPVHISTQAGVVNYLTATELFRLGASRVVLARELALEEIAVIRERTPPELELEAFVHGAMCMSFSGRCLLSQYMAGRDANRGECAQPCRWNYRLVEEKRPGQYFPVFEEEGGACILSARDLCMLPYLDKLVAAGVSSFKIEGRAKSAYYTAAVTGAYRQALDLYLADPVHYSPPDWLLEEVRKVSHREYSTGFYLKDEPPGQFYRSGCLQEWEVVAVVEGYENGALLCTQRGRFFPGDELEALVPRGKPVPVEVGRLLDGEGNEIASANHAMMSLCLPGLPELPPGSMLRKRQG